MNIAYAGLEEGKRIGEVLELMNIKSQRKRIKLQNHHNPKRTKWATWLIGRIGDGKFMTHKYHLEKSY